MFYDAMPTTKQSKLCVSMLEWFVEASSTRNPRLVD